MTKEEIKKEIAECEEKLKAEQERLAKLREELSKPEFGGKRWKPKKGERYYYIDSIGEFWSISFENSDDAKVYAHGNCFKTREEAEFEAERRKVIRELSDFAEGDEAVWDGKIRHFYILYSFNEKKIIYEFWYSWKPDQLCFPSEEVAKAAVEAVGQDRVKKYYLGIKEA